MSLGFNTANVCPKCKAIEYMAGKRRGGCTTCRGVDPKGARLTMRTQHTPAPRKRETKEETMPVWTEKDVATLRDNAHKGADEVARILGRPKHTVVAKASSMKVSLRVRDLTPAPPVEKPVEETAEPVKTPEPARHIDEMSRADCTNCAHKEAECEPCDECRHFDSWEPREGVGVVPRQEDIATPEEIEAARAEDEHRIIEERIEKAVTLRDLARDGLKVSLAPKTEDLRLELIDTHLRLIEATIAASSLPVIESESVTNGVERVRHLVREVTA